MKLVALIAAYNEEKKIAWVVKDAGRHTDSVVVVDDGSTDGTAEAAKSAGAIVLSNDRNLGKGESLRRGLEFIKQGDFDWVVMLDGDGQHDPSQIPEFVDDSKKSGADVIVGNRMRDTAPMPPLRRLTNRAVSRIISFLARRHIPDPQCGFRLFSRHALERISISTARYEIENEMVLKAAGAGLKISSIPVRTIYADERSKINPVRDTLLFIRFALLHIISKLQGRV